MAQINTYTNDTVINNDDKVIGSDSANSNVTRNFRMEDISDYVIGNLGSNDVDWDDLDNNPWTITSLNGGTNNTIRFTHNGEPHISTLNTNTSIAANDVVGHWHMAAGTSSDATEYVAIRGVADDVTDGAEVGQFQIQVQHEGTLTEVAAFDGGTTEIKSALKITNETGDRDRVLEAEDNDGENLMILYQDTSSTNAHLQLDVPLDIKSYDTSDRDNIEGAQAGWVIWNTTTDSLQIYDGSNWGDVATGALTASRAVETDSSGNIVASAITSTELGYLDGVTSSIQTQINNIDEFAPGNTGNANQVLTKTASGYNWQNAQDVSYTLTPATNSTLGGVIVQDSSDLSIDSGGLLTLGNISANKITSGVLGTARIPSIQDGKIDSETATNGQALIADGSGGASWGTVSGTGHTIQDDGSDVANRAKLNIVAPLTVTDDSTNDRTTVGLTLAVSDVPNLSAGKITSGVFSRERLSSDTPTGGQVLKWNATTETTEWGPVNSDGGNLTIDDFGDQALQVSAWAEGNSTTLIPRTKLSSDTAATDDVLTYDGTNVVWAPASGNEDQFADQDALEAFITKQFEITQNLKSTTTGVTDLILHSNPGTIGAGQDLSKIDFNGRTLTADTEQTYASILTEADTIGDSTYDGKINIQVADSGTLTTKVSIDEGVTTISNKLNLDGTVDGTIATGKNLGLDADGNVVTATVSGGGGGGISASDDTTFTGTITFDPGTGKTMPYFSDGLRVGANATANELDDYEEGTWTPNNPSSHAVTLTNQAGSYTKVGRMVYIQGTFTIPTTTSTSTVTIDNLPFAVKHDKNHSSDKQPIIQAQDDFGQNWYRGTTTVNGAASFYLYSSGGTLLQYQSESGDEITFTGTYYTDS